jgi:DNA invertase Pin-like site-specific DNA recombinase
VLVMDYRDYEYMSLDQLAVIRDDVLNRLQLVTEAMRIRVVAEHQNGVPVNKIARKTGLTRATVYAWLKQ